MRTNSHAVLNKLLPLFALFSSCLSLAQPGEIVFSRFTKETGLAANLVTSVIKDHKGYYWISCINGLQRYDGHRMVSFRHIPGDPGSLPDNNITCLMEDKQKRLWLSAGGIPCIYDPLSRSFKKIKVEAERKNPFIKNFYPDRKGVIWMVDAANGLFFFDTSGNSFKPYSKLWPAYFKIAQGIAEDAVSNRYWLATDKGILLYDPVKRIYYSTSNNPEQLSCFKSNHFSSNLNFVYVDKNNILWTQTWISSRGFTPFRFDIKKNEFKLVNNLEQFRGFITDQSGKTWAYGSILGVFNEMENRFVEIPRNRNSLYGIDFNAIYNMYEDREGNLWVMTDIGLFHFNPPKQFFSTVTNLSSFLHNKTLDVNTNGFIEASDGNIIATCWNGDGLVFLDPGFRQINPLYGFNPGAYKDPNYLLTWCGLQDHQGLIWIGCQHGRVLQINPATQKISALHPSEFDDRTIRSIYEDKEGNIWLGAQKSIIVKWERTTGNFTRVISEKDLKQPAEWTLSIIPGNNNDLWAGTSSGGLLHLDLATGKIIEQFLHDPSRPASISDNFVRDLIPLSTDTLAVATSKGIDLFLKSSGTFLHINEQDGLPGDGVISLVADDNSNLWLATVEGIAKIHLPDRRITQFDTRDGVTENDFQPGSSIRLKNGRIAFGNTRGFVHFDPRLIKENGTTAGAVITGFRIFDRDLSIDSLTETKKKIRLKSSQNFITIQFASLENIIHNRPSYYYMLEGINQDWIRSENGEAVYSYLPPGDFNFKIRTVSTDGNSSPVITLPLRIRPAFYQAWWFYLLSAVLVSLLIYIFYRLRINKLLAVEKIRTRVARDLHDDMGSTLSTINILSSMAKTKIAEDPRKTSEYISKISDNSQRMMEAMDDIVWSIRPMNDSMLRITARMREFASSILEPKGIEVDFNVDEKIKEVKLDMETRRDFFLIFKEAVNNVAKYSQCTKCTIEITIRENRVVMNITDNGIGFDINNADTGNGLSNMQKRAEAMGGKLMIRSGKGKGTRINLSFT